MKFISLDFYPLPNKHLRQQKPIDLFNIHSINFKNKEFLKKKKQKM